MVQNNLSILVNTILNTPVWVQEVIYEDIKKHLDEALAGVSVGGTNSPAYPSFRPELTFKGKKELETHEHNLDFNIYKYLSGASENIRVIDITLNNFWTLEESSKYLADCIKYEFIKNPEDPLMSANIFYLGNEIRLGEYVKRLNKINIEELDEVLRKQKQHNEENPDSKLRIGEIMIKMGYVANQDIDKILFTKEEAKKRFILANNEIKQNFVTQKPVHCNDVNNSELLQKIEKLTAENKLLKDKLRQIFNIQNKNK